MAQLLGRILWRQEPKLARSEGAVQFRKTSFSSIESPVITSCLLFSGFWRSQEMDCSYLTKNCYVRLASWNNWNAFAAIQQIRWIVARRNGNNPVDFVEHELQHKFNWKHSTGEFAAMQAFQFLTFFKMWLNGKRCTDTPAVCPVMLSLWKRTHFNSFSIHFNAIYHMRYRSFLFSFLKKDFFSLL